MKRPSLDSSRCDPARATKGSDVRDPTSLFPRYHAPAPPRRIICVIFTSKYSVLYTLGRPGGTAVRRKFGATSALTVLLVGP